jgi:helicase
MSIQKISQKTKDGTIDLAIDTLRLDKQAIIFVNSKRSAESVAEKIAKESVLKNNKLEELSHEILKALSSPTKQCTRLAGVACKGIAFHHSGLVSKQRELIEEGFRERIIKIIVATPTLAAGLSLPAFRVIIRDLKRFGLWGMQYIPVLEYEQQIGRAGRPEYDTYGQAICIANTEKEKDELKERYIDGEPEEIISKLAVEPVMRTYILSLISSGFVNSSGSLEEFFSKTFYAYHYSDDRKIKKIIEKMIMQLSEWGFLKIGCKNNDDNDKDFISAFNHAYKQSDKRLEATILGKRVAELYIDPYTANFLIRAFRGASESKKKITAFSIMHLVCCCLEIRPLLSVKRAESGEISENVARYDDEIITEIPEPFDESYEEFLQTLKTAMFFNEWLEEKDEEYLLEKYDVRPGEINAKKDIADWILYTSEELCKLSKMHILVKDIAKTRLRLKYGSREELIPLLQLKNIGRIRARTLYKNSIKDIAAVKQADITTLSQLIGKNIALDIKKQVGQDLSTEKVEVKENKRKGQISLKDY